MPTEQNDDRLAQLETQARWLTDLFRLTMRLSEADGPVLPLIVGEAARILDAPIASVDVIQRGKVVSKASVGLPDGLGVELQWPQGHSFSAQVIQSGEMLHIADAAQHQEWRDKQVVVEMGVRSYLGAPVRRQDAVVIAALAVMSPEPDAFNEPAGEFLTILSEWVGAELERQSYDHELRDLKEKFKRLSIMDELTGVYNREFFMERLDKEIKRAKRYGSKFAMIMFDVDHFKRVNDEVGEEFADLVLREAAVVLKSGLRDVDLLARYGGEEFIALLPETTASNGLVAAARLCHMVRSHSFADERRPLRLTISAGVTSYPPETNSTVEVLIDRADEALCNAKRDGGDCVRRAT